MAFAKKILTELKNYKTVNLYLDNDKAGFETLNLIKKHHNKVVNQAAVIYLGHNDFNSYLCD